MNMDPHDGNFSGPSANAAKVAKVEPIALNDLMICWSPGGDVMVIAHPDVSNRAAHLSRSDLACCAGWRDMSRADQMEKLWAVVGQMAVRDGVPVAKIREALSSCATFEQFGDDGSVEGPFA